ncbi:hypothetical protein X747_12745 [Mesorhizobium sp. LNJC384A00]|nr:hypothetical protein X747_12745 [Mesorhizobium sp. LNJC384A00]
MTKSASDALKQSDYLFRGLVGLVLRIPIMDFAQYDR